MNERSSSAEVEIQIGNFRMRIVGSEEFIQASLSKSEEWIGRILKSLEESNVAPTALVRTANGTEEKEKTVDAETWYGRIARDSDVSTEFVKDIFNYDESQLSLVDWDLDGTIANKQRTIALILAYGYRIGLATDDVSSNDIGVSCRELGVKTKNLAANLEKEEGIRSAGSQAYAINIPGMKKAQTLLQEMESQREVY